MKFGFTRAGKLQCIYFVIKQRLTITPDYKHIVELVFIKLV